MSEIPAETNEAPDTHCPAPFTVEVMVSAGPRKAPSQYETDPANAELCEDCAGAAWVGDTLLFWLSDGASEAKVLPRLREAEIEAPGPPQGLGFSTRALAKDLGQAFVSQAGVFS